MNPARYEELLSDLFDGELSDGSARELAEGLGARPDLLRDLCRHLLLWEVWSQHQAPERSATAFLAAWRTRLHAENEDAAAFQDALKSRLELREEPRGMRGIGATVLAVWTAVRRPAGIAWITSVVVVGLAMLFWLGGTRSAQAVTTIQGEAVCTACVLHESHEHLPAIRVTGSNSTQIYYLDLNAAVEGLQERFCNGPTPVVADGIPRTERGRLLFEARRLVMPEPAPPPPAPEKDERVLFPI
jgi:hypothetical protein